MRGLGTQALLIAVATACGQVSIAVIFLLTARETSPANFGHVVAGVSLGVAVAGFIDFGTNNLWVRDLSLRSVSGSDVRDRMITKTLVSTLLSVTWCLIVLPTDIKNLYAIAGPVATTTLLSQTLQVPLRSRSRGELVALSIASDRLSALGAFLTLRLLGFETLESLCAGLIVGPIIGLIVTWWAISIPTDQVFSGAKLRSPWKGSTFFGLSGAALSAQNLDLPILAFFGGGPAAGVYGAVNRWTQPMGLLASSFATAAGPYVARAGTLRNTWVALQRTIWIPAVAVLAALFVALCAPIIVEELLGAEYSGAVPVLRVPALASMLSVLSQTLSTTLQFLGNDRVVAVAAILSVFMQIGSVVIVADPYGAKGVAWSSFGAQAFLCGILAAFTVSKFRHSAGEPK
jgi:O-antigen/teichoic acid export membrane protein